MNSPYLYRHPFSPMDVGWMEDGDPDTIVEQSGWRSTDQILGGMQDAGRRLQAFRLGEFDLVDREVDDSDLEETPVFRTIGADFVDMTQDVNRATLAALRLQEAKKLSEAPRVDPEAPGVDPEAPKK